MPEPRSEADPPSRDRMAIAAQGALDHAKVMLRTVADGHEDVSTCVTDMMQESLDHLVETFGKMAKARAPLEAAHIYADFLITSAQRNARQMVELGQVVGRASVRAWTPPLASLKGTTKGE